MGADFGEITRCIGDQMKLIIDKKQVRLNGEAGYCYPYISKYGINCVEYKLYTFVYEICRTNNCLSGRRRACKFKSCSLLEYNGYNIYICGKLRCDWLYI